MLGLVKDYLVGLFAVAMAVVAGTQLGDAPFSVLASNTFIYMIMLASIWGVLVLVRSIAEGQRPAAAYRFLAMIVGGVALMIIFDAPLPPLEDANAYIGLPAALSLLAIWYLINLPKLRKLLAPITFGKRSAGLHDPMLASTE